LSLKTKSDSLCYQTRKQLGDLEGKISPDEKEKVESLLTKLEEASTDENYALMKELNEQIKTAIMELGQQVYNQSPDGGDGATGDDVIETDFSTEK
jgi:molecular chaperone DnaK (HSP70)